jgi:hypothetical protein
MSIPKWTSIEQTDLITHFVGDEENVKRPVQLPLSFPAQFADKLLKHHSNPALFFGAQVILKQFFNIIKILVLLVRNKNEPRNE